MCSQNKRRRWDRETEQLNGFDPSHIMSFIPHPNFEMCLCAQSTIDRLFLYVELLKLKMIIVYVVLRFVLFSLGVCVCLLPNKRTKLHCSVVQMCQMCVWIYRRAMKLRLWNTCAHNTVQRIFNACNKEGSPLMMPSRVYMWTHWNWNEHAEKCRIHFSFS